MHLELTRLTSRSGGFRRQEVECQRLQAVEGGGGINGGKRRNDKRKEVAGNDQRGDLIQAGGRLCFLAYGAEVALRWAGAQSPSAERGRTRRLGQRTRERGCTRNVMVCSILSYWHIQSDYFLFPEH